jgi:hypothetical protein
MALDKTIAQRQSKRNEQFVILLHFTKKTQVQGFMKHILLDTVLHIIGSLKQNLLRDFLLYLGSWTENDAVWLYTATARHMLTAIARHMLTAIVRHMLTSAYIAALDGTRGWNMQYHAYYTRVQGLHPSSYTLVLGLTQPPNERSTKILPEGIQWHFFFSENHLQDKPWP